MAKNITFRLDDRLIHGQVATLWVSALNAERIVVIDDQVAVDEFQKEILTFVAPPNVAVDIYSVADAEKAWKETKFTDNNVLVLFKNVDQIKKTYESEIPLKALTIGQTAITGDRKLVHRQVGFTEEEAKILLELDKEGVDVFFQMIPTDGKVDLIKKLEKTFCGL